MIYTIGHSNYSMYKFAEQLVKNGVELVIDVRRRPGSRKFPHFGRYEMPHWLGQIEIRYDIISELVRHKPEYKVDKTINAGWISASFHQYADCMLDEIFEQGLMKLITLSQENVLAIMGSEACWWRSHRKLIADALLIRGIEVKHIIGKYPEPHSLSELAVVNGLKITYPVPEEMSKNV